MADRNVCPTLRLGPTMEGIFRRRRLPHWDVADATYFVTGCLAGSISAAGLKELNRYRADLDARPCPPNTTEIEWENQKHKLVFKRLDDCLTTNPQFVISMMSGFAGFSGIRYTTLLAHDTRCLHSSSCQITFTGCLLQRQHTAKRLRKLQTVGHRGNAS